MLLIVLIIIISLILVIQSCNKYDLFQDQHTYGGQDIKYKKNPNGTYFHYVNVENNVILVPDESVYTNKTAYSV